MKAFLALTLAAFIAAPACAQKVYGPVDLSRKIKAVESTKLDIGEPKLAFDRDEKTLIRTPAVNPAYLRVQFDSPVAFESMRFVFSGDVYVYSVAVANTLEELRDKKGAYRVVVKDRKTGPDGRDEVVFKEKQTIRAMELDLRRTTGDDYVHILEWQLCMPAQISAFKIQRILDRRDPSKVEDVRGPIRVLEDTVIWLRAVTEVGGHLQDVTREVTWTNTSTNLPKFGNEKGKFLVRYPGNFELYTKLGKVERGVAVVGLRRKPANRDFDLEVQTVERLPRIPYDGPNGGLPAVGSNVTWRAHLWNWGPKAVQAKVKWKLAGASVADMTLTLKPMRDTFVDLPAKWESARKDLTVEIAPVSPAKEVTLKNNALTVQTNAVTVGFWVERSLWDFMHERQRELPTGDANSFAGWGQRMMRQWNQMFADAKYKVFPDGIVERVRLDKVVVVPDFSLPLAGGLPSNNPDNRDKTVDMVWGMEGADVASGKEIAKDGWWSVEKAVKALKDGSVAAKKLDPPFWCGLGYIHEMNHARYLVDSYGFNVHSDTGPDPAKWSIKVTDENGPIMGRYIPLKGDLVWSQKHVGQMGGDYWSFSAFEAMCWNRVAGKRARGGNYNSPETIGEFLQDVPKRVVLQFVDDSGKPLDGAEVTVYRARGTGEGWYTKVYDDAPAMKVTCDASGKAVFDKGLWTGGPKIEHTYGVSQAVTLLRVTYQGKHYFLFECVADANIAYNLGQTDEVVLKRRIKLRTGDPTPDEWNPRETWEVPGEGFGERQ